MDAANIFGESWDLEQDEAGFAWKRLRLGQRLGAEALGASVLELPPGQRSFPYHFHRANEELLVVLDGTVAVRTPDGEHELAQGAALAFPRGPEGAHQIVNRSDRPARILVVSTMVEPDIVEYPDARKVGLFAGAAPGGAGASVKTFLSRDAEMGYFEGEPLD